MCNNVKHKNAEFRLQNIIWTSSEIWTCTILRHLATDPSCVDKPAPTLEVAIANQNSLCSNSDETVRRHYRFGLIQPAYVLSYN